MQALQVAQQRAPSSSTCGARKPAGATGRCIVRASSHTGSTEQQQPSRRAALAGAAAAVVVAAVAPPALAASPGKYASDYTKSDSGLLYFDVTTGSGAQPKPGDVCVVHWAGRTKNYQAKIFGNSSLRDEPYVFTLGAHEAIPAIEEAVAGMQVGGVRRIEVLGEIPALGYPRDRSQRFVSGYTYRFGPQPQDLGGQRALDFVLDNDTLNDTNRTLLIDIKLLALREGGGKKR